MSFYKVLAAIALLALGVAIGLALPTLSPDVEAGLSSSAVKSDRLDISAPTDPEPVKLDQATPEPPTSDQVKPGQLKPEPFKPGQARPEPAKAGAKHEPVKPDQVKPDQVKPDQVKSKQAKPKQVKAKQAEPRQPTAKNRVCGNDTWSYYEPRCQRTRTKYVNGVRTTRIAPADPTPTE